LKYSCRGRSDKLKEEKMYEKRKRICRTHKGMFDLRTANRRCDLGGVKNNEERMDKK
jgi:hypothetical protein